MPDLMWNDRYISLKNTKGEITWYGNQHAQRMRDSNSQSWERHGIKKNAEECWLAIWITHLLTRMLNVSAHEHLKASDSLLLTKLKWRWSLVPQFFMFHSGDVHSSVYSSVIYILGWNHTTLAEKGEIKNASSECKNQPTTVEYSPVIIERQGNARLF